MAVMVLRTAEGPTGQQRLVRVARVRDVFAKNDPRKVYCLYVWSMERPRSFARPEQCVTALKV